MWRNGRRARFRSVCPKGRGGSTPPIPTKLQGPLLAESVSRGPSAYLLGAPSPPKPPRCVTSPSVGGRTFLLATWPWRRGCGHSLVVGHASLTVRVTGRARWLG